MTENSSFAKLGRAEFSNRAVALGKCEPRGGLFAVTSEVPQAWFVLLQDEAAAGRVIVPLRPFLKFSRRMDKQLIRLQRQMRKKMPQLARRGTLSEQSRNS